MLKRCVVAVMISISTIGLLSGTGQAHLAGSIGGWHYASVGCTVDIDQSLPGQVQCAVSGFPDPSDPNRTVIIADYQCANKKGNQVIRAGISAYSTVLVGTEVTNGGSTTPGGDETVTVEINTDPLLNDPTVCFTPDKAQWFPIAVIVREFVGTINLLKCSGGNCSTTELTSQSVARCRLPAEFTFENPPTPGVTQYVCDTNGDGTIDLLDDGTVSFQHLR
jgi:hypothetical protein